MLYLFGRLALSDSLAYHENFLDDDYFPATAQSQQLEVPGHEARAAAVSRRLRRGRHCPQPGQASASRIG